MTPAPVPIPNADSDNDSIPSYRAPLDTHPRKDVENPVENTSTEEEDENEDGFGKKPDQENLVINGFILEMVI